ILPLLCNAGQSGWTQEAQRSLKETNKNRPIVKRKPQIKRGRDLLMSGLAIRNSARCSIEIAVVFIALLAVFGAASAQVTIEIWGTWSSDSPVISPLIPLFEQYEAENPNVKVSYSPQAAYFDRITVAAATGV